MPASFIASRKPAVRAWPFLRACEIVMRPTEPSVQPFSFSAAASASPTPCAPSLLSEMMNETYSPLLVPMSATTTGIFARAASASTLGAVELSVGEIAMPATPRAIASCAFLSWVSALLCESSAV